MKQDRLLYAILSLIGLLMILAVALFFLRPVSQDYGSASTPEGVVRNYILALQKGDYARAYSYLHESEEMPTFAVFQRDLLRSELEISRVAVHLGEVEIVGHNARVTLTTIHGSSDPFERAWDETTTASLVLQNDIWKLSNMPHPFWGWDWYFEKP